MPYCCTWGEGSGDINGGRVKDTHCRRYTPCLGRPEIRKSTSKVDKPFLRSIIHLSTHRISNWTTAVCNVHVCLNEHTFMLYKHTPLFKRLENLFWLLSITYIQLVQKYKSTSYLHMHTHQIHVFKYKDTRPYEELTEIHTRTHACTHNGMLIGCISHMSPHTHPHTLTPYLTHTLTHDTPSHTASHTPPDTLACVHHISVHPLTSTGAPVTELRCPGPQS